MIELAIVDPEGGEPTQKSNKFNDPRRKHVSLLLVANRTEDKKGMDLSWNMHFSKKSKDRHKCTRTVETTIVHPTDNSKNLAQKHEYVFTQKHNVYEIHNFIVFSTLKEGGYFTYAKSPILIVTGKILPKAKEASPTCTLRVPVNESGTSLSPTPSGSPTSSVGSSNEGHDDMGLDPECYVEKVAPLPKAEGPFRPLLKIEDFKAVAMAGKTICSEPQKLLDKYMWKLIVKFSDDCCMSLFAEVMCVDEVWELKTEVAFYVINESQTYDSLDFRFVKTFKNGNNVKGYKSLIKLTKLEQEGFLSKEGGLSLHCTVTNDLPGAAFKMFKFQCSSATEIEVNGFTSQEQGTLYSRWAPLEGLGQWRAFCCPRGLATYRKFVSCGFQVEPSAELQINGTRWMASFTARAEILRLGVKKGVKTEDSNNSGSSSGGSNSDAVETVNTVVEDAVSFTNVRVRASVNEFVPVEAVLKPENQFMSTDGNDTIIIKFNLKPLNASNPNKIVSKKAALAAKERVAASLKKLNESLDTLHKSCVTLDETKVKVLTRFQTLAQNVQKYADAYNTAVVLTERYAQLDEEIRGLEARESALLGRCVPADAQKLLETVTASAALLAQRLASVPEGTVPVKSELPPFGDDGAKISFPSATPPGNKGMCLTFVEAWDRMLVAGYRVSQACIESGIALEEICALNETMREEYSRVAGLANEKKKVVDKMGPYRQSIWDKWARLKKDVNVLEGNVDVINSLTRKEAEKYIGMAEEAQENFKAAAGTK